MKRTIVIKLFVVCICVFAILWTFQSQIFHFSFNDNISQNTKDALLYNASRSLKTSDVPVGSVLIYNNEIIGEGFNTVLRDTNTAGHAEINAINDAVKKTGFDTFSKLNRDSLILITTFEPCMMCRGAIIEYNIKHVVFLKGKGIMHWLKNDLKQFRYEWNKKNSDGDFLQDSLFNLHPGFPGRK